MMNEKKVLRDAVIKLLIVVVFATLYSWGGMEFKWLRRFLAPTILTAGMFYFTMDWKSLVGLPLMFGSLSLGYGADETWIKIIKRWLFGLANGSTTSTYNILYKRWLLVFTQIALCTSLIIILGVWNPLIARAEELTIGVFISILPLMSARRS